jgi:glutamyl/glutaminyl-tRNA synthetase
MNDSVQKNSEVKVKYSSNISFDIKMLSRMADEYTAANPDDISPRDNKINLMLTHQTPENECIQMTDLRGKIQNKEFLEKIEPLIKEIEDAGIKTIRSFHVHLIGNNKLLNYPRTQVDPHTHVYGELLSNEVVNTCVAVMPVLIVENITEYFWAKWVNDIKETLTPKMRFLTLMKNNDVMRSGPIFAEWWDKMRTNNSNQELQIKLPKNDEKLILDFDSRRFVHGVDEMNDNIYLVILFDGYTRD